MEKEHLTIYYDRHMGCIVDIDQPDNPDGTRNIGNNGWRFDTPEEICTVVKRWFATQIQQKKETL